jgi:hypothetical protein
MEKKQFASLSWSVEDVLGCRPRMTEEQAYEFLINNQNQLRDRLCELGNQVLDDLLDADEYTHDKYGEENGEES